MQVFCETFGSSLRIGRVPHGHAGARVEGPGLSEPSRSLDGSERPTGTPDGKENIRRGRPRRDLPALVRGPVQEPGVRLAGGGPQDDQEYLAPAEAAGITPGGPSLSEVDWAKLLKSWFPELASRRLNQVRWAEIEPHRDYVKSPLGTTTVTTIHQQLGDDGKLKVALSTFRRWVHENLLRRRPARRSRCCGRTSSRARRPRSTTASWGSGSTRRPGNGTGSRRS